MLAFLKFYGAARRRLQEVNFSFSQVLLLCLDGQVFHALHTPTIDAQGWSQ